MIRHSHISVLCAFAAVTFALPCAHAAIVPASLFCDSAVLQQKMPVPVWGTATPGEPITVTISGQSATTIADGSGRWSVRLKPLTAGGPFTMTIAGSPGDTLTLNDVCVGEVWICSGQSNMEFPVKYEMNAGKEKLAATDSMIRYARIQSIGATTPQSSVLTKWTVVSPTTVADFSAVAYHFGRSLRADLHVPIGLIGSYWGGTTAEAWTSYDALTENADLRYLARRADDDIDTYPDRIQAYYDGLPALTKKYEAAKAEYDAAKAKWDADSAAAKAAGQPVPPAPKIPGAPKPPLDPTTQPDATHLYNGMISPLIPYAIRGAIWYQGESNAERAYEYKALLPTMIEDWRRNWGEGDFPFLIVQLAPYKAIAKGPTESNWAELREAQRLTAASTPNTGLAVITDIGDSTYIHPWRKQLVGERLAIAARGIAYGEQLEYSGPVLSGVTVNGSAMRVTFTHADGLHAGTVHDITDTGAIVASTDTLIGFEVAGKDEQYYPAEAKIDGSSVIVSSAAVHEPVAVRYGWADYPVANLENSASLWASPFRTGDWKWTTAPRYPADLMDTK